MRDVVIVGAGVIGATVATELTSRCPGLTLEIVDKDARCEGASRYAGAIDGPYSWTPLHTQLQRASWRWHQRVEPTTAAHFRRPLTLRWLGRSGDREQLADVVRAPARAAKLPVGYEAGACLSTPAYVIDPPRMIGAFLQEARAKGLIETRGNRVRRLEPVSGRVRCHLDNGETRLARHVVLAVGPWFGNLAAGPFRLLSDRSLRVKRVHGLRIAVRGGAPRRTGWADPDRGLFLFPRFVDSDWAMSINHAIWGVDPDQRQPPDENLIERAKPLLDSVLGPSGWTARTWPTFADTYTGDRRPLVTQLRGGTATLVSGTHGSGVRLAPALAQRAADLVIGSLAEGRRLATSHAL